MKGKRFLKRPVKFLRRLVAWFRFRFRYRRARTHKHGTASIDNVSVPPSVPPSSPTQPEENNVTQPPQPQNAESPPPPGFSAKTFEKATIQNDHGNFIATVGDVNTVYHNTVLADDNQGRGKEMLRELVVRDAMHTGKVRADPLECDPNTRLTIIEDIISWIEDDRRDNNVLWLCGPAGIGKSAIAKTIADILDRKESSAKVAGSFFFFRSDQRRNTLQSFVPTLIYTLAVSIPVAGTRIYKVIEEDPEVLLSDVKIQWKRLVVETVVALHDLPPATMVIDGLDECGTAGDQRVVLELVASCGPHFPISFFIASRPEPHIVNSFNSEPLLSLCRNNIDLAAYKDDQEMKLFIKSRLSKIYTRHRDLLQSHLTDGLWPSEEIIDLITLQADGQFIYPVTLFKYIDEENGNPNERLQSCLKQLSQALSPIDAVYQEILRSSHEPDDNTIQDFLFLLMPSTNRELPTLQKVAITLNLDPLKLRSNLRKLHSVIDIPEDDYNVISIHHQSLVDFLLDPHRSLTYHINQKGSALRIIDGCLSALERYPTTAIELVSLLHCWWSCSQLLSYQDVSLSLALRMEQLDLEEALQVFPGVRGNEFLSSCYQEFIKTHQSWVHLGRESESTQDAESWGKLSLLNGFEGDILSVADEAQNLRKGYMELEEGSDVLSWKALLVLGRVELKNHGSSSSRKIKWLVDEASHNLVHVSLSVLAQSEFANCLPKNDLFYLSNWSRAWKLHRGKYHTYPKVSRSSCHQILELLNKLPREYHCHTRNKDTVLSWLQWTYDRFRSDNTDERNASDLSMLIHHWEGVECYDCPESTEHSPDNHQNADDGSIRA